MACLLEGLGFVPEPAHVEWMVDSGTRKDISSSTSLFTYQYHSTNAPNSFTTTSTIQSDQTTESLNKHSSLSYFTFPMVV